MSTGRKGGPTTATSAAEDNAPDWMRDPETPDVTDPDAQQVAVPVGEVVEGDLIEPDAEAMRRAADYALSRKFQAATTQLLLYIAAHAQDTADLNVVILEQMSQRLLTAESADDVLDPFGTVKGQQLLDKPLMVTGAQFLEGDFKDGFPWYVSLQVESQAQGGIIPVTVGGEKLVFQVASLDMHDAWPQLVEIHRADKPTKQGFYPLELRRPH